MLVSLYAYRKEEGRLEGRKEEGRERLPVLLEATRKVREDLWMIVEWFIEVCRRRRLKVNVGKIKVMVMNVV